MKVCDQVGIELATPVGSAVRHASVVKHVTDCTTQPGDHLAYFCFKCRINKIIIKAAYSVTMNIFRKKIFSF